MKVWHSFKRKSLSTQWRAITLGIPLLALFVSIIVAFLRNPIICLAEPLKECVTERPILPDTAVGTGAMIGLILPLGHLLLLSAYIVKKRWAVATLVFAFAGIFALTVLLFELVPEPLCTVSDHRGLIYYIGCVVRPHNTEIDSEFTGAMIMIAAIGGALMGAGTSWGYAAALGRRIYQADDWITENVLAWSSGWAALFGATVTHSYLLLGLGWILCWSIIAVWGSIAINSLVQTRQPARFSFLFNKYRMQVKKK